MIVTGGCGYIGNLLLSYCYKSPLSEVMVIDNLNYNQYHLANECINNGYNFWKLDLTEQVNRFWLKIKDEPTTIIHLAAMVGAPICDKYPEYAKEINQRVVERIANEAHKDSHIIYMNTNSAYGDSGGKVCTEESPISPISIYGQTKQAGEEALLQRGNSCIFRLATVFGVAPRIRYDLLVNNWTIQAFLNKKLSIFEPEAKRNFVHVKDVCFGIKHAMVKKLNGVYNLGHDESNTTKMILAETIKRVLPETEIEIIDGKDPDQRNYNVSSEKLSKTGFKAKIGLEAGIAEVLYYCRRMNFNKNMMQYGTNVNSSHAV